MKIHWPIILICVLLAVLAVIFVLSAQPAAASNGVSRSVTRFLLRLFSPGFKELDPAEQARIVNATHGKVRKYAHFTEYAVLSLVLCLFLRFVLKAGLWQMGLGAFILSAGYAVLDEWHQTFVAGRAMQTGDMLLDGLGALAGVALVVVILLCSGGAS
ncbi:MAG: VanZ family protein [Clostridia bacterium]|nr:VanZ family protein [Clostridia bacterium]